MQSQPTKTTAPNGSSSISEVDLIRRTTRVLRQLYHREKQWLSSRTADQIARLTQQDQLSLSEQLHYGEVAFVLLRLKPCAIIDYAGDRSQLDDYVANVIRPTIHDLNALGAVMPSHSPSSASAADAHQERRADSNSAWYPRPFRLACKRISGHLESPEVPDWTGAYVLFDDKWPESANWSRANLLNESKTTITENELARGLDYPGSIPNSSDDMQAIVPVSYLGRMKSESGEWMSDRWECLTSFIVLQNELPQMALHRIRYQAVRMFDIEMEVNMDTSMIDEFPNLLP
ncbi:hypothetical protein GGI25_003388 [Coemansia spiralis]|uniref:Uncharacterized protein n=2 Tax=Coemansia TaxID=4863 RepID=A0A9W8G791_9FUNG|nr:hypothetical protein EDC05_003777 [Coemansia umbellata]KAJ2621706.1 hypothetical protein GGI26_003914 [Coemansia sp. RSA 1358]KAJ2676853.1 hypothetical protein GGI25_003388 [Coemansia spiralis]